MADDLFDDPIMQGHFEQAGIKDDPVDTKTADTTTTTTGETNATVDGTATTDATKVATQQVDQGATKQTNATKDSTGDGTNSGTKQDDKTQGQNTGNPRDLKLADGTVIKAGAERRFYETAQTAKAQSAAIQRDLDASRQQTQQLTTELATMKSAQQAISSLPAVETQTAVRMYSDLKRDPVGTITKLLAEVKSLGHNIDGIGGSVDTLAVQTMLDRRDAQRTVETTVNPAEIQANAEREVGVFFSQYPDAVVHDDVLANIINKHPQITLRDAYFQLRQSAIDQGYDWGTSLGPQVAARQAATGNANQTQNGQQTGATKQAPMTNGRTPQLDTVVLKENEVNPVAETYSDIIRAAMAETGYQPN